MTNKENYYKQLIDNREYVPERDLVRIIKYGTCNLIKLWELDDDICPFSELTIIEKQLVNKYLWSK